MGKRRLDAEAKQFARDQRATANEFAQIVWQMLRNRRCCGEKFRREHVICPYTVDFCCLALKLVVEVDGKDHFTEEGKQRDRKRDQFLSELGYEVVRVRGYEVLNNAQEIREQLVATIESRRDALSPSPPAPLPETGRGEP